MCVISGAALLLALLLYCLGHALAACRRAADAAAWRRRGAPGGGKEGGGGSTSYAPLAVALDQEEPMEEEEAKLAEGETSATGADEFSLPEAELRLVTAIEEKNPILVGLLIGDGANPNAQLHRGETMLHLATELKDPKVCRVLLTYQADVDRPAKSTGTTALHLAAELGAGDVALTLLEGNADVNARDLSGATPLAIARRQETEYAEEEPSGMVDLLKEWGGVESKGIRRKLQDRRTAFSVGERHDQLAPLRKEDAMQPAATNEEE